MHRFDDSLFLLKQCHKNYASVLGEIDKYFKELKFVRTDEIIPLSGNKVIKFKSSHFIADDIRYATVSTIKDLRSAIDQAVYAAITILTGIAPDKVHFPVADGPTDLRKRIEKSFPKPLWGVLEGFQAYRAGTAHKGGNEILMDLHDTSNISKHKFTFKVGGHIGSFFGDKIYGVDVVQMSVPPRWDWLKGEIIIAEVKPDSILQYDFKFEPLFVFGDAGPVSGCSVTTVLKKFLEVSKHVVNTLKNETMKVVAPGDAVLVLNEKVTAAPKRQSPLPGLPRPRP